MTADYDAIELAIEHISAADILEHHQLQRLRVSSYRDATGDIIITLARQIAAYRGTTAVRYPKNWREAVREEVYNRWPVPDWIKLRWPVRYRVITASALLPDFPLPKERHFNILSVADEEIDELEQA